MAVEVDKITRIIFSKSGAYYEPLYIQGSKLIQD